MTCSACNYYIKPDNDEYWLILALIYIDHKHTKINWGRTEKGSRRWDPP